MYFIVTFEQISQFLPVVLLLGLNRHVFARKKVDFFANFFTNYSEKYGTNYGNVLVYDLQFLLNQFAWDF